MNDYDGSLYDIFLEKLVLSNYAKYSYLSKSELVPGKIYVGKCRNGTRALWDGIKFTYQREKFGFTFPETILHPEDDSNFDVFYPFYEEVINDK